MSRRLVALLVGIDAYLPPVNALYGCRNDIGALEEYLRGRADADLDLRVLLDGEATRDTVIAGFRDHLCTAKPGDVALFAYAGHGSEEPAPPDLARLEPTGRIQTLVLHDCGRRIGGELRRPLADRELALLLAEVAAGGAHVAVVLDCCHSGSGTRDPHARVRGWRPDPATASPELRDLVLELDAARPPGEFLAGTLDRWTEPVAPHVALSACRSYETAKEHRVGSTTRGAFSVALVEALDVLGTRTTYRSLMATVRAKVERTANEQRPELYPLDPGGAADGLFLDGSITPVAATFTVTRGRDGWEVDAGTVHGLVAPAGDDAFVLACTGPAGEPAGRVRVVEVGIGRSRVEPVGWDPIDTAYQAVVADVPLPPAVVRFDLPVGDAALNDAIDTAGEVGDAADDDTGLAEVRDLVVAALATAGPGGGPSPHVRPDDQGDDVRTPGCVLRVGAPHPGTARIARADGTPVTVDTPVADAAGAQLAARRLEHVARWHQVHALGDHPSPLREAVLLDLYAAAPGETRRPIDRPPLLADGGYRLDYATGSSGEPSPPHVFAELRSRADVDLYVALLDLTDRYRCHAVLPTARLAAGHVLALWGGAPIPVRLPAGRPVVAGAMARDWLKLIVSDVDFDATAFDLPQLDEPVTRSVLRAAPANTLERIAARAVSRDLGAGPPPAVARWAATTVTLETRVPASGVAG